MIVVYELLSQLISILGITIYFARNYLFDFFVFSDFSKFQISLDFQGFCTL